VKLFDGAVHVPLHVQDEIISVVPDAVADIYAEHNLGVSRAGVSQSDTELRRLALKRKGDGAQLAVRRRRYPPKERQRAKKEGEAAAHQR
jgi:hypothetical protein